MSRVELRVSPYYCVYFRRVRLCHIFVLSCVSVRSHLCEDESLGIATVQTEDKADGLEQFLDAAAELFLLQATGRPGVEESWLDDEFKQVLQSLSDRRRRKELWGGVWWVSVLRESEWLGWTEGERRLLQGECVSPSWPPGCVPVSPPQLSGPCTTSDNGSALWNTAHSNLSVK